MNPDHRAYYTQDEPATVGIWPVLRDPVQAPANPPSATDMDMAVDVVLWHLADGYDNRDHEVVTYAHVVTDLHRALHQPTFLQLTVEHTNLCDTHGSREWPTTVAHDFDATIREYLTNQGYHRPQMFKEAA